MKINTVVKLKLESRVRDLLAEGKSEKAIATILSKESKQKVTDSAVHRYIASQERITQEVIERSNELKVKVLSAELDTVQQRHEIIKELRDLATQAKDQNDISLAIAGLHRAILALDSLDKRLGKFMGGGGVQVNVNQTVQFNQQYNELKSIVVGELCGNCKERVRMKLHELVTQ